MQKEGGKYKYQRKIGTGEITEIEDKRVHQIIENSNTWNNGVD